MIVLAYIVSFWIMSVVTYKIVRHEKERIDITDVKEKLDFYVEALKNVDRTLLKEIDERAKIGLELMELSSKFHSVDKTAEDAKKLVSQIGIAQAFVPRNKRENKTTN